ncbi:MAG TPA: NADH-quinone oxidoreductase subunit C [Bacteriovoracaceae bacterium]|nr:NADH-quinone oxidoreductase subunit C [Bacteriovoracaceae bacterium]
MRTNSISPGATYVHIQDAVLTRLNEKYLTDRKVETDKLNEPVIWAKNPQDAKLLVKSFMIDPAMKIDFLSDLTAYDNDDREDGDKRFVLVYQLYSIDLKIRVRIKCLIEIDEDAPTITDVFLGANWLEREVFDMYGIKFKGHPNLRRIMMDERFTGYPMRKEYPIKQREPFGDNVEFHLGANPLPEPKKEVEGEI